jgi:hypothetical protein
MAPAVTAIRKNVGFPVYAVEWWDDSIVVASGGGGIGHFGVTNKIVQTSMPSL